MPIYNIEYISKLLLYKKHMKGVLKMFNDRYEFNPFSSNNNNGNMDIKLITLCGIIADNITTIKAVDGTCYTIAILDDLNYPFQRYITLLINESLIKEDFDKKGFFEVMGLSLKEDFLLVLSLSVHTEATIDELSLNGDDIPYIENDEDLPF